MDEARELAEASRPAHSRQIAVPAQRSSLGEIIIAAATAAPAHDEQAHAVHCEASTAAHEILRLLQAGQAAMAISMLETLPTIIEWDVREQSRGAYLRGYREGGSAVATAKPQRGPCRDELAAGPAQSSSRRQRIQRARLQAPAPRGPRPEDRLDRLRKLLGDPGRKASIRRALRLDDRLLDRVAAGALALAPRHWRQLRVALS